MPREPHTTTVIVPGLRGHVEDHWQTRLAAKLPNAVVVPSFTRDKRDLAGRVADLHQVISDANTPVTIVAHSAGVLTTVHWALRHDLPVRGALLATPPDLARPLGPLYPSLAELRDSGWLPIPLAPLRFPTIVAASTNDVLGDVEHVRAMAARGAATSSTSDPSATSTPRPGTAVARRGGPPRDPERKRADTSSHRSRALEPRSPASRQASGSTSTTRSPVVVFQFPYLRKSWASGSALLSLVRNGTRACPHR